MTIDDKIRDEELQYDTNREAAIISALSSGKIDKYAYLTGDEIRPSESKKSDRISYIYLVSLGNVLEKQRKVIEDQGKKQIKAIEDHGKQLVESNELIKKDFNNRDSISLEQKNI